MLLVDPNLSSRLRHQSDRANRFLTILKEAGNFESFRRKGKGYWLEESHHFRYSSMGHELERLESAVKSIEAGICEKLIDQKAIEAITQVLQRALKKAASYESLVGKYYRRGEYIGRSSLEELLNDPNSYFLGSMKLKVKGYFRFMDTSHDGTRLNLLLRRSNGELKVKMTSIFGDFLPRMNSEVNRELKAIMDSFRVRKEKAKFVRERLKNYPNGAPAPSRENFIDFYSKICDLLPTDRLTAESFAALRSGHHLTSEETELNFAQYGELKLHRSFGLVFERCHECGAPLRSVGGSEEPTPLELEARAIFEDYLERYNRESHETHEAEAIGDEAS